ncbi:MAG: dipeptide ABC transporter ATP-binding protein [Burkholderiales bacterium]|nr:dipeptide ABC transporter ATP-binding protein [Anaerolineae bacterium]
MISDNIPNTAPLIEVAGLTIDFWNQDRWVNVVKRVTFAVNRGEAVGLVGESGCGKTTTAYTLLGYQRPNSRIREGKINFDGRDLLKLRGSALQQIRGKRISLVPQNPTTALSPGMPIGRQILEVLNAHHIATNEAERKAHVYDLLAQVRLPDTEATALKFPHQLSGGQQQRVVIAMALACNPELLVLDEPTTGLDVTTQAQILELLARLRAEHGMAMLYVTHDLGVVNVICDHVGVMYAGELVEDAPTRELFANPRHPYTRGLIASVPRVRTINQRQATPLRGLLQRSELPQGCPFAPRCDFALPKCFTDPQTLTTVSVKHRAACWRWPEIPALARTQPTADANRSNADPNGAPILEARKIDAAYDFTRPHPFARRSARRNVVQDVSFDIRPRETFALVGESGSGKSTIARAVAGLLVPVDGSITFEGRDIVRAVQRRDKEQRREIQLVFQNPDASLNPRQRVRQIIGQPLRFFFGLQGDELRLRVEQLLDDVRLDRSYVSRFPDELSGGERQRVAIARALAAEPKLMLCDEILSALDVSVQASILELLRVLQVEHNLAYLFISHDLAVVRSLAHRVGVLYRGQLCEVGQVEEVYSPPYHPYTHMLLLAVPEIAVDSDAHSLTISRSDAEPNAPQHATACPFADRCPWKLGPICDEVAPPWQATSDTHALRCHIPLADLRQRETWSSGEIQQPLPTKIVSPPTE